MSSNYLSAISILIVEDNEFSARVLRDILGVLGGRAVDVAANGEDAIERLERITYDLILLDWEMPKMDGIELAQFIRKHKNSPDIFLPIIMITAHANQKNVVQARDAGINEYLIKPCSPKQIMKRLQSVIEQPRPFIRADNFFGPDRRRQDNAYYGGEERRSNSSEESAENDATESATDNTEENPAEDEDAAQSTKE